jgi:hypothetical protein
MSMSAMAPSISSMMSRARSREDETCAAASASASQLDGRLVPACNRPGRMTAQIGKLHDNAREAGA